MIFRCRKLNSIAICLTLVLPALVNAETFNFPPKDIVLKLTPEILKFDPIAILFSTKDQYDTREEILVLMEMNPSVFEFLPKKWKDDETLIHKAIEKGLPIGIELTGDITARTAPDSKSPKPLYASYTPNRYLADKRESQKLTTGDRLKVLETRKQGRTTWYKVTAKQRIRREADRKTYDQLMNVGHISFEDFTLSVDAGWIPKAVTKPSVLTENHHTGIIL